MSLPLAVAAWGWSFIALLLAAVARSRPSRPDAAGGRPPGGRRRFWLTLVLFVVVPAAVFAAVAALVFVGGTPSWDISLLQLAARHQRPRRARSSRSFTALGSLWLVLVLLGCAVALLLRARLYRQAAFVATATVLSMSAAGIMKLVFARSRPEVMPQPLGSFSFPSGHTMSATGLAVSLAVVLWPTRWRVPALVVAAVWAVGDRPVARLSRLPLSLGRGGRLGAVAGGGAGSRCWASAGASGLPRSRPARVGGEAPGAQRSHARLSGDDASSAA